MAVDKLAEYHARGTLVHGSLLGTKSTVGEKKKEFEKNMMYSVSFTYYRM